MESPLWFRFLLLSLAAANGALLHSGEETEAIESLVHFTRSHHMAEDESVLGMVGFYGQPLPPQWLILTTIEGEPDILKESVFARNEVIAERRFRRLPGQDLPTIPISLKKVSIDSDKAFAIVEAKAKVEEVAFESLHYQLRCRTAGHEPVWLLSLLNRSQSVVGLLYVSASSGEILEEKWPRRNTWKIAPERTGS